MKKQEQLWFSHDCTAANSPKMVALLDTYGITGYGMWWRLMEILRNEDDYKYDISESFSYTVLAKFMMSEVSATEKFINDCINTFKLLQTDCEFIWSDDLLMRMEHLEHKRVVLSERGKKGAAVTNNKRWANASQEENNVSQDDSVSVASVSQTVSNNSTIQNKTGQNTTSTSTKHNNTLQNTTTTTTHNITDMELWKQELLNDEYFLNPYLLGNNKLTKEKLSAWLTTFNKRQAQLGETHTSARDYRQHFVHWFRFRDPVREDPDTFLSQSNNKATAVIPAVTSYMKTPAQIIKEEEEYRAKWHSATAK